MAVPIPERRPEHRPWQRRWPARAPAAAAGWGVLHAAVQTGWVLPPVDPGPPFTAARQVNWTVEFGGPAFAGLGTALVLAVRSCGARARPVCAAALEPAR